MPYKTILMHINDESRLGNLIDVGAHIANRDEAHLIGLHVVPSNLFGSVTGFGARIAEGGRQAFRDEGKRIAEAFEKAVKGRQLIAEWRMVEPAREHPSPAEAVLEQSRSCDLIIASQSDDDWDYSALLDFPEQLAIGSGRPVLMVPKVGRFPRVGQRIIVAWNGKKEAARAAFDALPMLQAAQAVQLLCVDPTDPIATSAKEAAAALARHGVKCEVSITSAGSLDIGNLLLNRVADYSADMMVMGVYGHSRFREFILGGASRSVLKMMTVPVLMAH